MANEKFTNSQLPIRRTVEILPQIFQTESNQKFLAGVLDPLVQPGLLEKTVGYVGRRYGKTFKSDDIYLDTDQTLRSRYQLEPGVVVSTDEKVENFYDYLDFKNIIKFFGNNEEIDSSTTSQEHYTWNPPIDWDKFINYREYYWIPSGPPGIRILGQAQSVISTYRVALGTTSTYLFTPDGLTNNPTITLYRGQTYKFQVNAPNNGLIIRTSIDTGTLAYNPFLSYSKDQYTVFDGKLWRAKQFIPAGDGSTIDLDSQDWELVEDVAVTSVYDYNKGVTNNGVSNGTLTFEVPYDAPDVLFYQSITDPNRVGKFIIANVESNTKINVEKEVIGKTTYRSSNGVEFSNGMVVYFEGMVEPAKYAADKWVVEGVGDKITLTRFSDLIVSLNLTGNSPEILFDNGGFDNQPFDDASAFPGSKDYITINRSSIDSNPWSRYNRWFHRSVLETAFNFNNSNFDALETARAKRPIIEFQPNIQLFNYGSEAKQAVDYIDDFTTDIFSTIEGSQGYIVDGEFLFEGARVLVVSDTDTLANNRIYTVKYIRHNNNRQINLVKADDTESIIGECVYVRRGNNNAGKMFHFDGTQWKLSQEKTKVNQPPMFDLFDKNNVSFSDSETYPVSSFIGTKILSYKLGNSILDTELGFSLSYLNIDNVGDIQFNFDLDSDVFQYQVDQNIYEKSVSTGFYKKNNSYYNGWDLADKNYIQPIIDSVIVQEQTNEITLDTIDWERDQEKIIKIIFYVNGIKTHNSYTRTENKFIFAQPFSSGDVISVKVYAPVDPVQGYYEIPIGFEKNPLNDTIIDFTLGQAVDHVASSLEISESFSGIYPGVSNLRDIIDYKPFCKRFLKHAGNAALSTVLLCDKEINLIKSLQYAKKSYTDFKNNFIALADTLYYDQNSLDFVDEIIKELSKSKTVNAPFSNSDMIGSGAYTSIEYTVEDEGIKTFALTSNFSLNEISSKAVYVYINNSQLLVGRDYEFDSTFGFLKILLDLSEGDVIQIREYVSTSANYIPPTPTKLGLYKKYTPMKFLDDTYSTPIEVIQGHDGSITVAYGDYRDDLLLELEYRIYNNIKQEYSENIFNIDDVLGGYYGSALYNKSTLDKIVSPEFLKWISDTNVDYVNNSFFDSENSFTYTYSNMTDPSGDANLPGYWRGVYQWFYDTVRPHICPWEMLGFSEKPKWWESEYGPAPYTGNNLILWEDLRDGIIRQGPRAGTYDRYKRPTLLSHVPVDGDGNLLSPLDSGLAGNFTLINNQGNFKLGDVGPVEYAWRASSEWPFAITIALCLLKPYEFIGDNFNKSLVTTNRLGQTINNKTETFLNLKSFIYDNQIDNPVSGLVIYIVDYLKSKAIPVSKLKEKVLNIDVKLSSRVSGFVDKQQQRYVLDSKNPKSTSSSVFIPQENYEIYFNVSSPISSLSYSGVILEKTNDGWKIAGYDSSSPFFNYYEAVGSQTDPLISVGGVSENFLDWTPNKFYGNGVLVRYANNFYRSLRSHTSDQDFDTALWKQLPGVPLINAVEAKSRRNFNKLRIKTLNYGTVLNSIQQVVDFLLGYQEYLKSIGFVFDNYDSLNQVSLDWYTSAREFMFWSKHNWAVGSLLTLSPSATSLAVNLDIGVAENFLDSFYDYQILKNDGTPLPPAQVNVLRDYKKVVLSTTPDSVDGIYFARIHFVLKEHVTIFDDRTVFNDVIYDKPTGYRQERIKVRGFRTVDWDGDYTSPGFLFDNVDITVWQPFTDYKLGDIVSYKSYFWTSKINQLGSEIFVDANWTKLDSSPEKGLVANYDYRINQFEDYYEVESDGVGSVQRELARHAIGYQQRTYLQNIAEDEITQFRIYQGFIKEKGTANSVVKVFDKLSRIDDDSVVLNEEWAFKIGELGGIDQINSYELKLNKDKFVLNPQPILFTQGTSQAATDQFLRIPSSEFTIAPVPYTTNLNPLTSDDFVSRNAGYVKLNSVDFTLATREDILNLDINTVKENSLLWITFDSYTWNVLKYNESTALRIEAVSKTDNNVQLTLNRIHNIKVGDIIGLQYINNLTGFYKVTKTTRTSVTVVTDSNLDPELIDSSSSTIGLFSSVRFESYRSIDPQTIGLYSSGIKIFVDNNGSNQWEILEKTRQYKSYPLLDYGITDPRNTGSSIVYIENLKQIATGMPSSGYVMIYSDQVSTASQGLGLKQIVPPPSGFETSVLGSFGSVLATSPDFKWLAVGSPLASGVKSKYRGDLNTETSSSYRLGDIVLYNGKLWEAIVDIDFGESSSIDFKTEDWKPATVIEANIVGRGNGYSRQGMVSLYSYVNNQWEHKFSFVSPRASDNERFGSAISIGVSGSEYFMAVSATGSLDETGRVYLYKYNGTQWTHLENTNYAGLYNNSVDAEYVAGNIVWHEGDLWQAAANTTGTGVGDSLDPEFWIKLDPLSTQNSLPTNVALTDDGSTLAMGLLSTSQLAELVKSGDNFGYSIAMDRTGELLIVGTPNSDGEYFTNYRGQWNPYQEYRTGDVVKFMTVYYQWTGENSSLNEIPDDTEAWLDLIGDSSNLISGKIYIYQRINDVYTLVQTITANNLSDYSDIGMSELASGDQFGFSLDIDASGTTLVVSSPQADANRQNQGAVYVFKKTGTDSIEFRLTQKLSSYEDYPNEYFGSSISISKGTEKIVVGAKNSPYKLFTGFEAGTSFDKRKTTFSDPKGFPGQVYVFERKDQGYLLAEKLETDFVPNESFGSAVDCTSNIIVVGSPLYKTDQLSVTAPGLIRIFKKDITQNSLNLIEKQSPLVDISLLKNIELYDDVRNIKLSDIDVVDSFKFKILGLAEQNIKFKTIYDPAVYEKGSDEVVIDESRAWFENHVGEVWWDLSTVKFAYYEQGDLSYRIGNWNSQVVGSQIDIYEWVETPLLPSEWAGVADTVEGLAEGISGQPKDPTDLTYNTKVIFNPSTGQPTGTLYYYWVKNKAVLPTEAGRTLNCSQIRDYINNPAATGLPFVAVIDTDKILAYNFNSAITSDTALLNVEYNKTTQVNIPVHREYQLLTEGVADSLPTTYLEKKWIDSLVGFDEAGNIVPDPKLPIKQRYGLSFRPRQSMFVDRNNALRAVIENINSILLTRPFTDILDFKTLNLKDNLPSEELNEYDVSVNSYEDLLQVGTVRIRQAVFSVNIINGQIDTIDIVDPGFGYRKAPPLIIVGDGNSAKARAIIDSQGRVSSIVITNRGKKYTTASVNVRAFSVLVIADSTENNFWSIYTWDQQRKIFYRIKSQGYDVTNYWEYVDWWKQGYSVESRILVEINNLYQEPTIDIQVGDLLRVKEYADGGWAVLEKTEDNQGDLLNNYNLVARESGTIQIKDTIWSLAVSSLGYDNFSSYDTSVYDLQPVKELRLILQATKENIFVDDLRVEWNKLFFSSVKYAFSEQPYIDWAFKTSFLSAVHNVGDLEQKTNYKSDNLDSYKQYIDEVKPYRTTIRKYTSRYTEYEPANLATTDFDLPPSFSNRDGQILPISQYYNRLDEYPWKWWADNIGFSIVSIEVSNPGSNYRDPPTVLIEGNGTGATAKAFIANGKVSGIKVLTQGSGYTSIPKVTLVGGNGTSPDIATAVPILGNSKARTFNLSVKFDRICKTGLYSIYNHSQTITATGLTAVFDLTFAPTRDKRKITITLNGQIVLSSDYEISLYKTSNDGYSILKGKIKFTVPPKAGDIIVINYEKNDDLLDSVNRIDRYYSPVSGMRGKELPQLMTGVDFGGVLVQGTTFDVTGGWDALPWFADNWDSVESNSDFYYVINAIDYQLTDEDSVAKIYKTGSIVNFQGKIFVATATNEDKPPIEFADVWQELTFKLPYVPVDGQLISIYLKKAGELKATRIDDPYFSNYDGSTVQPNGRTEAALTSLLPTFVGDGSTQEVDIQSYGVSLGNGDTLIFRLLDSDGSVIITDVNLLDTRISGGSLNYANGAYSTATGKTPAEIVIDGDKFVSPDQVPAPEENVPGQVLESLSIKVFNTTSPGSSALQNKVVLGDGETRIFDIGITILESKSLMVYVNKDKKELELDYNIDYVSNTIEFSPAPPETSIIEIIAVGTGGVTLLDYQEFVSDGETSLFLTKAVYQQTSAVLVTVNGIEYSTEFVNSSEFIDTKDRTMIQFGVTPAFRSVIKILCLGSVNAISGQLPVVRVNQQTVIYDGSTRSFELDNFVNLEKSSQLSGILVNINNSLLKTVDTKYQTYDGTNNSIEVGIDPDEVIGVITSGNINVYINDNLQRFVIDYTYNGNENLITIPQSKLSIGDIIRVETTVRTEYSVSGNTLTIDPLVSLNDGDRIEITWFSEYPTMNIIADRYTGGQVKYQLDRVPLSDNYIWVYKNGQRLTKNRDYSLSLPAGDVYLRETTTTADEIQILIFGELIYQPVKAYEIFKDMLNNFHYKRHSRNNNIKLVKDLNYYDTSFEVTRGDLLADPIPSRKIPGVVIINNERIEYFTKEGNVISQLRRGSLGTGIATLHKQGSFVVDAGASETVPYNEGQEQIDFFSDGSSTMVGPLDFVPAQATRVGVWSRTTIPAEYGPCDELEVFVAGRRLRKNPIAVFDESKGPTSPAADTTLEAEFSVDGAEPYIRLTSAVPAGTKITIIRRQGRIWYNRGENTASSGESFLSNNTPIIKFIAAKGTELPE